MTTINTQEEFLKALDDNPQWRDAVRAKLLGEDLLSLPAKFDAFVERMTAFVEQMTAFVAEQQRLNAHMRQDIDVLKAGQARLEGKVDQRGEQLDRLEGKVDQRGEQLDRLESKVDGLEGKVDQRGEQLDRLEGKVDQRGEQLDRLEGKVDGLEGKVDQRGEQLDRLEGKVDQRGEQLDRLEGQVSEQGIRLSRVEGHVSNIRGSDYERKVIRRTRSIARRTLKINTPRIVHSVRDQDSDELADLSEQAERNGLITAEEAEDLERTDLIVTGTSAEGNEVYVLAEASVTASHLDIERSRGRAAILQRAVGAPVQPAVACAEISAENSQQANQVGVTVIIEPA